ncbi:MAG: methyltransferase [Polyangiaceae bacterium]
MTEASFFQWLLRAWVALAAITALSLLFLTAPYGRHQRAGWGPVVAPRIGWVAMETPAVCVIALCFALRPPARIAPWVALGLWELHYVNRAFVFPFRMPVGARPMPLAIVAMGALFNCANGYLNGRSLTVFGPEHDATWLRDPRFALGCALFLGGLVINQQSDAILRALRGPGETGYKIPTGGMYRFVSCPNYFGEMVEWIGWALLTGSLAGWSFALWTAANLAPRAFAHHRWYLSTFPNYPRGRKALIPFVA